ncbi:unnamed protein product [Larinioides sclopetarius]|uniref:Uncharacterized protein n=1 Tax=Larinioides sclopetarius TaxID=280406 RepID=A0AAV2AYU8_9ARAC
MYYFQKEKAPFQKLIRMKRVENNGFDHADMRHLAYCKAKSQSLGQLESPFSIGKKKGWGKLWVRHGQIPEYGNVFC